MLEFRNTTPAAFEHESFVALLHSAQDQIRGHRKEVR